MLYVVRLKNVHFLSDVQPCFTFVHPKKGEYTVRDCSVRKLHEVLLFTFTTSLVFFIIDYCRAYLILPWTPQKIEEDLNLAKKNVMRKECGYATWLSEVFCMFLCSSSWTHMNKTS